MTDAQRAADNAANRNVNAPYDTAQFPDRGVTGDTTTAIPIETVKTNPDGTKTIQPRDGEVVATNADGTMVVTHKDGKTTVFDARGNAVRSNVPGKQVAIDVGREKATPTNPRFPGEGNPDFKG
jgi:hypothetical protein